MLDMLEKPTMAMRDRVHVWLTPQEVGTMTGFSASFIRNEIHQQALPAQLVVSQRGRLGRWRIHRDDAIAYAVKLGVWRGAVS